ncbi:MAG TPA: condensation domain-containing protein, partial [Thermoanaerobaculia bacterium]|nr:condensation domain-containing protein [Thermoanaerobaculia bacterium]
MTHANATRLLSATAPWFGFGERDVWTLFHSYAFDFSVWEIWGALALGGRLVVVPYWVSRAAESFYELLVREGVTVLNQTPSAFRQLIATEGEVGASADLSLRWVIFGGEALDLASLAPWVARHGAQKLRLINMYGITETTVHVTYRPIREQDVAASSASVIGHPIPDLTLHVLGGRLELQPIGCPGELCVGGAGLARGYLGRPELTAERFVPDPWAERPGERLYRSGDLGRRRWDGDIEYLGRIDHQVKVRGFRIEPGEIEAVLATHPDVRECAVLARRERNADVRLVAYLVASSADRPADSVLREHLRVSLPEYMLPAAFVVLAALPLTANGKLDRGALPAPEEVCGAEESYLAPRDPVEEILVAIWQEILGLEGVGVRDDFFALGGHSLLAAQVVSRAREAFQVELPVRRLFEGPTVEDLARAVEDLRRSDSRLTAPPIVAVPREGDLPLSFGQQRLWLIDQLEPGLPAYNVPWAVDFRGELAVWPLRRAFEEVVSRHEVLRTTFGASAAGPVQVIAPSLRVPMPVVDLSALPESVRGRENQRLRSIVARHRFSLSQGPLLRLLLLHLAPDEYVLLATFHHIVSDGWSVGVLMREVVALYSAALSGVTAALPVLPVQYADYAAWQRRWLSGEVLAALTAHWLEQLAAAPRRLDLPTDRPRPALPRHRGRTLPVELAAGLSRDLAALSRQLGVTPFMTFLAAWGALLGRLTHQLEVLLGTPIANRNRREIEGLIGFFVNTLVLRVDLTGEPSFRDLLKRVRNASLAAFNHQDLPFDRLVEALAPDRDPRQPPLFQVLFALQSFPAAGVEMPGLETRVAEVSPGTSKFDLTLGLTAEGEKVGGGIEFDTDLFDPTTVLRHLSHLENLLKSVVENLDRPVADLPLLADGERRQLLEWGGPRGTFPAGETLAELFAAQVRRAPHASALTWKDRELTYA